MYSRKLLLTIASVLIIFLFFSPEVYEQFIKTRIFKPVSDISKQLVYMERRERMSIRHGSCYIISDNIAKVIRKKREEKTAIVLLPPRGYIQELDINYPVPEPVVFYYFTGLQARWVTSTDVQECNYAVVASDGKLELITVDKERLQTLLALYGKYNTI